MKIKEVKTKSIITKSNLPGADFVINPYIGCSHACIYCYADFMKKFTGHLGDEWGEFVDVKINADETIDPLKIDPSKTLVFGSVTDPYQATEAKYEITRKCLEKLLEIQPKIEILTKSDLILRDTDLLKKFNDLRVVVSIGILDEKTSRKLEPHAPSPVKRINTLKKLHESGIKTVLFVSPIFPEISDVILLIDKTMDFVDGYYFENLNIRANNREKINKFLRENYPNLIELYSKLGKDYWEKFRRKILEKCKKENIKYKIFFYHGK